MESQEKDFSFAKFLTNDSDDNSEERERMKKLLREGIRLELTQRQRDCIGMKYIQRMKADEIASELDISVDTVYKHIRVGMAKLKKLKFYL